MPQSRIFDSTLAIAALASLVLVAFPASAQVVTGYETGYEYRQGLATGAGARLMAADDAATPTIAQSEAEPSVLGASTGETVVAQNAVFTPGAQETTAVAPEAAPATTMDLSTFLAPAMLAIVIALLALLGFAIWAVTGPVENEVSRATRRGYRYQ